ncbi:hypothetical protein LTR84_006855 [Exophiala bonariae]|uniref:Uncharacterized protein n=1 Tax=Exophiala bonariae TaxID=1690606 RepID=A0AAV9N033_9EURO|nr:hypothetical protein LTR84_006855 [Exophiala bonariae]
MHPTSPTSPSFPPPSPLTPHSPYMSQSPLMAPLAQNTKAFFPAEGSPRQVSSPSLFISTSLARRSSNSMSICSPRLPSSLNSPVIPALYNMRTPDRACFQGPSSALKEDGRKSRMAMRSPPFDRVMTLPLRVNTSMFPQFTPEPMASINEHRDTQIDSSMSNTTTLVDWPSTQSPTSPTLIRPSRQSSPALHRSPIRRHFRGKHLTRRLPPPPQYHVTVTRKPSSPTTLQRTQQYLYSIEHLRAPLVPLISVSNGLPHPSFPTSLLQYHLLTHKQLDSLAKWYHQVTPPVEETFMYPAWVPAWTSAMPGSDPDADGANVDLEVKRRRWGRFIGLRGCESPTATGPDGEAPDELVQRMEREWRRAIERAEEEDRAWEKSWRGRW